MEVHHATAFPGPASRGILCLLSMTGCGSDREERGMVSEPEVAVPEDARDLGETQKQREAEAERPAQP